MSSSERPLTETILAGVKKYQTDADFEAERQSSSEVTLARLKTLAAGLSPVVARLMRDDAIETAGFLTQKGIEPNGAIVIPGQESKIVGYEFMFPRLASYGIRKWKPVYGEPVSQTSISVWIVREWELHDVIYAMSYGEQIEYNVNERSYAIGLEADGNLLGARRRGSPSHNDLYPPGELKLQDEQIAPSHSVKVGLDTEEQPLVTTWRKDLASLAVSIMTNRPYTPSRTNYGDL